MSPKTLDNEMPLQPPYQPLKKYSVFDDTGNNISKLSKFNKALVELDGGNNKAAWETVNKSIRKRCWICNSSQTKGPNKLIEYEKVNDLNIVVCY